MGRVDRRGTARVDKLPGMAKVDSPRTASRHTTLASARAYANYQELEKKKSPIGWWIAGAALVIVIIVVAVLAIRAVTGGDTGTTGGPVTQPSQDACPPQSTATPEAPASHPADGRVHGGPVSYPQLGTPWSAAAR